MGPWNQQCKNTPTFFNFAQLLSALGDSDQFVGQDDLVVVMLMGPPEHNYIVTVTPEAIEILFV